MGRQPRLADWVLKFPHMHPLLRLYPGGNQLSAEPGKRCGRDKHGLCAQRQVLWLVSGLDGPSLG